MPELKEHGNFPLGLRCYEVIMKMKIRRRRRRRKRITWGIYLLPD